MAFQPVIDAGQAVVRGEYGDGTPLLNVFGCDLSAVGTFTQADADDFAGFLSDAYALIMGSTSDSVTYNDVVVTDLRTEGAPEFVSTNGWPLTGTDTAQPMPFQTAALVSYTTALRGRSFRGRTYVGGLTESDGNGKVIASGTVTQLQSFGDSIVSLGVLGVISRYHDKTLRTNGILTIFTGDTVNPHWRSQRRRSYA